MILLGEQKPEGRKNVESEYVVRKHQDTYTCQINDEVAWTRLPERN